VTQSEELQSIISVIKEQQNQRVTQGLSRKLFVSNTATPSHVPFCCPQQRADKLQNGAAEHLPGKLFNTVAIVA